MNFGIDSLGELTRICCQPRARNKKAMMHGLDRLLISLIHNNVTLVDFFLDYLFVTVFIYVLFIATVYCFKNMNLRSSSENATIHRFFKELVTIVNKQ